MIYGYSRVSTNGQAKDGNSLESQEKALKGACATKIFTDAFTEIKTDRPEFDKLIAEIKAGDTLVVTKLDRFARSMSQGSELVSELIDKGIRVYIFNIGVLYGITVNLQSLKFSEMEINCTFELKEEFYKYHRILRLMMFNLPKSFKKLGTDFRN